MKPFHQTQNRQAQSCYQGVRQEKVLSKYVLKRDTNIQTFLNTIPLSVIPFRLSLLLSTLLSSTSIFKHTSYKLLRRISFLFSSFLLF